MKSIITGLFVLLLLATRAFAVFSAFALIDDPDPENDHFPKVSVWQNQAELFGVKITQAGHKHAWLIVSESPLDDESKNFRELVWHGRDGGRRIELIAPLSVSEDEIIDIALSPEFASRSYIYLDFSTPVDDGGYYYTIDIQALMEVDPFDHDNPLTNRGREQREAAPTNRSR